MAEAARKSPIENFKPGKIRSRAEPESGARSDDAQREGSRWDHPIESLRREWDRALESFPGRWPFGAGNNAPLVDVVEDDEKHTVSVELPGVDENDIELKIANGVLTVRAEKRGAHEEKGKDYYLSERSFGTFQRSLRVPDGVDLEQVDATFENGVLSVALPKTHEARQREKRIPIKGRKG